jgi:hypothetical protein
VGVVVVAWHLHVIRAVPPAALDRLLRVAARGRPARKHGCPLGRAPERRRLAAARAGDGRAHPARAAALPRGSAAARATEAAGARARGPALTADAARACARGPAGRRVAARSRSARRRPAGRRGAALPRRAAGPARAAGRGTTRVACKRSARASCRIGRATGPASQASRATRPLAATRSAAARPPGSTASVLRRVAAARQSQNREDRDAHPAWQTTDRERIHSSGTCPGPGKCEKESGLRLFCAESLRHRGEAELPTFLILNRGRATHDGRKNLGNKSPHPDRCTYVL